MIEVNNLIKKFGDFRALDGVNMHVASGNIYGLVGPNGAGKSTLIRHLTGVYRQDAGEIFIDGAPVYENKQVKAQMAYIPDEPFYFLQADTLEMMRYFRGMYESFDEKMFYRLQEFFPGIDMKRNIRRLSRGMQKQVAFWLALCCRPKLLILDEPLDGLDPVMRKQIWTILMSEVAERSSAVRGETEQELIQVSADLKSSDLGGKQQQYEELDARSQMLADNTRQWNKILLGMKNWEEDDVITDYISNPVLNLIAELGSGNVTEELCQNLHLKIESAKQNIENEVEDYSEQRREIGKELKEKKRLVDDMKHNRKPYEENLRSARTALSQQLSDRYGTTVRVQIFADLFDVQEEEWKNAIEGRMGRLKRSLITEPQYAHEAAVLFRNMKQYENVDLINSKAIADSEPDCLEGSLYDAVKTEDAYVDVCLKRYLGHIMKCRSVEELEQVRDGVTPDCYSYSNFIFRHLKKKDYTTRACIGRRVSKERLTE